MITYKEITQAVPALKKITAVELPVRDAVKVARLIRKLDSEMEIYRGLAEKTCKKYGRYDEEGQCYRFENDVMKELEDAFRELDSTEAEGVEAISVKLPASVKIDAATLIGAERFIDFELEEDDGNGN